MNISKIIIFLLLVSCTLRCIACEVPFTSSKFDELLNVKVRGTDKSILLEVEAPKEIDGWESPQFMLWGNDLSSPVVIYLRSSGMVSKPNLAMVSVTGPIAMFKGTEVQVHYYKKGARCATIARKAIIHNKAQKKDANKNSAL